MVTPGCCCWYLAKARAKNGATYVEPAPVRVPGPPLGPALAAVLAVLVVALLHAPRARTMIAAAAALMAGCLVWRD
jgi:hypothetical protein